MKISRKGVPRVVWERKKKSKDPDMPPTVDHIPFLSVSRSLGDYWSWSDHTQQFVVSPQPDVNVHTLDPSRQRFVVLASDGLWNVMSPQDVVDFVWEYETREREDEVLHQARDVVRALIDEALFRWRRKGMFADNIAVVIAFLTEENTPSLGGSLSASSSQPVKREEAESTVSSAEANTAADTERTGVAEPPATVNHTTSTLCRKETLPGGAVVEEHTLISLHSHHKDREREEEEERKRVCSSGSLEEERSAVKRRREERDLTAPLPRKKIRHERDSGCESDGGSPTTEVCVTLGGSLPAEDSSSGVFTDSLETNLLHNPSSSLSPPLLS